MFTGNLVAFLPNATVICIIPAPEIQPVMFAVRGMEPCLCLAESLTCASLMDKVVVSGRSRRFYSYVHSFVVDVQSKCALTHSFNQTFR